MSGLVTTDELDDVPSPFDRIVEEEEHGKQCDKEHMGWKVSQTQRDGTECMDILPNTAVQ